MSWIGQRCPTEPAGISESDDTVKVKDELTKQFVAFKYQFLSNKMFELCKALTKNFNLVQTNNFNDRTLVNWSIFHFLQCMVTWTLQEKWWLNESGTYEQNCKNEQYNQRNE